MDIDNSSLYTLIPYLAIALTALCFILSFLWLRASKKASKIETLYEMLEKTERIRDEAIAELENIRTQKQELEIKERLAQQQVDSIKSQMDDWEKTKEKHIEAAKAGMMEATSNLSNKLLEDHKRENELAKKDSEERIKKTTEELQQKFQNVFENMKSLTDQVNNFGSSVDVIHNSLLNPQGAGKLAEVALENLLKNSGLEKGRDYIMQHSVESNETGKRLRPDAVVFLPGDSALVIDSKSSKFFVEADSSQEQDVKVKDIELRTSMNRHLSDLVTKDYKKAVEESLKDSKFKVKSGNIFTVMFLPTDIAAGRIMKIDPKFFDNAYSKGIIPSGPTGLVNILIQAKLLIERDKQNENYQQIIEIIEKMIDSVAKLHSHAEGLGKGLNSSMDKYNKFVGSFNSNFLSKVRKIGEFGISSGHKNNIISLTKYETFRSTENDEENSENE